jgi:hypothetical protein
MFLDFIHASTILSYFFEHSRKAANRRKGESTNDMHGWKIEFRRKLCRHVTKRTLRSHANRPAGRREGECVCVTSLATLGLDCDRDRFFAHEVNYRTEEEKKTRMKQKAFLVVLFLEYETRTCTFDWCYLLCSARFSHRFDTHRNVKENDQLHMPQTRTWSQTQVIQCARANVTMIIKKILHCWCNTMK